MLPNVIDLDTSRLVLLGDIQFQEHVETWMLKCLGVEITQDVKERNHRFLEEALELVQAGGCTASEATQLVAYVFGRPVGEKQQEVGGVMVTLAAWCVANNVNMHGCGQQELQRINNEETMEKIRAKQAAKPPHSPMPEEVKGGTLEENVKILLDKCPFTVRDMSGDYTGSMGVESLSGSLSITFLGMQQEVTRLKEQLATTQKEGRAIRRMLCTYAGNHGAYMDDGEASDASVHPFIDFLRDSPDKIQKCLTLRGMERLKNEIEAAGDPLLEINLLQDSLTLRKNRTQIKG